MSKIKVQTLFHRFTESKKHVKDHFFYVNRTSMALRIINENYVNSFNCRVTRKHIFLLNFVAVF